MWPFPLSPWPFKHLFWHCNGISDLASRSCIFLYFNMVFFPMKSSHMWSLVPNGWSSVFVLAFAYENQRHSVWSCWHTYIKLKKDSQIKKLTSVFYASVLLFIINFVIRLSKYLWICEAITNTSANETIFISPWKRPWRRHKHKHKDQEFFLSLHLSSILSLTSFKALKKITEFDYISLGCCSRKSR